MKYPLPISSFALFVLVFCLSCVPRDAFRDTRFYTDHGTKKKQVIELPQDLGNFEVRGETYQSGDNFHLKLYLYMNYRASSVDFTFMLDSLRAFVYDYEMAAERLYKTHNADSGLTREKITLLPYMLFSDFSAPLYEVDRWDSTGTKRFPAKFTIKFDGFIRYRGHALEIEPINAVE